VRIGVVGGSIAGCTAAITLARNGHDVTIYERSRGGLRGRGAGIGTPTATFSSLVEKDLVGPDTPRFLATEHPFVSRRDAHDRYGSSPLTLPLDMALLNWGDLWRELRSRVPDDRYLEGKDIASAEQAGSRVRLTLADGESAGFDLVLFADGYQSLGRSMMFPGLEPTYRGYVLWRGVLDEVDLAEREPLENALYRIHYKGLPGNAVFYLVPGPQGSTSAGERWVNWACYIPVAPEGLAEFLTDREGRQRSHSLPPGSMRSEQEARLKALMAEHLPGYFSDIIDSSTSTFAQPIYGVVVPENARGRIALVGDAGAVVPPFTGSGVFKAIANVTQLAERLGDGGDPDSALRRWSREQAATGMRLAALGEQMEKAFVWDAPDFSTLTGEEARAWWHEAITFPDEFSYVRDIS